MFILFNWITVLVDVLSTRCEGESRTNLPGNSKSTNVISVNNFFPTNISYPRLRRCQWKKCSRMFFHRFKQQWKIFLVHSNARGNSKRKVIIYVFIMLEGPFVCVCFHCVGFNFLLDLRGDGKRGGQFVRVARGKSVVSMCQCLSNREGRNVSKFNLCLSCYERENAFSMGN